MGSGFAVFGVAVSVVSVSLKRSEKEQQQKQWNFQLINSRKKLSPCVV
jgi:hypothetical protein